LRQKHLRFIFMKKIVKFIVS